MNNGGVKVSTGKKMLEMRFVESMIIHVKLFMYFKLNADDYAFAAAA